MKTKDIKKAIKGVFKLPVKAYYFGKLEHGCPYFYPWNYCSTIIKVYKTKPKFSRYNSFKLFGYDVCYGWPIALISYELGYKDKFGSPRFEWSPCTQFHFFGLQFCVWDVAPVANSDLYWEMVLWYLHYSGKDIVKAEDTWDWVYSDTKKSTWSKECLINN